MNWVITQFVRELNAKGLPDHECGEEDRIASWDGKSESGVSLARQRPDESEESGRRRPLRSLYCEG